MAAAPRTASAATAGATIVKPAIRCTVVGVSIFCSCCSCATDVVTSSDMVCSPSQKKFSRPDQRASRTIAIKPEVRGVKQLDDGIGYIFVRAVLEKPCQRRSRRDLGNAD